MEFLRKNWLVITLFLIIFFTRLLIFNKDAAYFWADEGRYPLLITNLDEANKSGNFLLPIQNLFNMDARPGAGLFYYPAAFLEWKIPTISFALYYNLIINSLSIILVFFIVKKIQNKNAAILATLLVIFSIASFIYIRHTLPYDIALLLLIIGLYLHVYFKKTFAFGLFAGFSFLTYPSYYYYIIPIPLLLILCNRSIKTSFVFILGISFILILTQFFSIAVGRPSYFRSLMDQSAGVTAISQGDYIPAASYIGEYILAVDGYWHLLLIVAIFPGLLLVKERKRIIFFTIYLILVFLILEAYSHILQKHVLYGRTVRPLYLLALGFSAVVLERVFNNFKDRKIYMLCISTLLIMSILNWWPRFLTYKNLIYPTQFKMQAKEYLKENYDNELKVEEVLFANFFGINSPPKMKIFKEYKDAEPGKFYIVNANQIFPYYGTYDLDLFCKNETLLKKPHAQYVFRPYLFEGYKMVMRESMEKDPLYYQLIYCKP